MATPSRIPRRLRFGEFELDLSTRELFVNGNKQALAPQPFQVLQLLIERRGQLVTRDELVHQLWPTDTFVDYDQGLKRVIKRLRETLNDSAEQPRFIENLQIWWGDYSLLVLMATCQQGPAEKDWDQQ